MEDPPSLPFMVVVETDAKKVALFEAMTSVGKGSGTANGKEGHPPRNWSLVSKRCHLGQAARLRGAQ